MNSIWSQAHFALTACLEKGVSEFVVCAGARNGPLVEILEKQSHIKSFNFFEERSAAFFALGRIRVTGKPVAVVTTSGTAVAETLSAVIEASYQGLPLLILSADRPRRYRGSGSPQTINQLGLFCSHVAGTWDFESEKENKDWEQWNLAQPFHFNVCFEEPPAQLNVPTEWSRLLNPAEVFQLPQVQMSSQKLAEAELPEKLDSPLVIVGPLEPENRDWAKTFLKETGLPAITETLSGLSQLGKNLPVEKCFREKIFKSVLRIGGVPTLRFWRDLENDFSTVPVVNVVSAKAPWSGLARSSTTFFRFQILNELAKIILPPSGVESIELPIFESASEIGLIQSLASKIQNKKIYLGNSLSIRNFDFVSTGLKFLDAYGNRGVNGIDGQISTYLGWTASETEESWCVVGDLTAMYDLSSLWVTPQLSMAPRRLVVVNNGGGMIFKKFSQSPRFLNRHEIGFSDWAKMWGWSYERWSQIPEDLSKLPMSVVIELVPNE